MTKSILSKLFTSSCIALLLFQSCKDDSSLLATPPVPDQSFTEEFDTLSVAKSKGWDFKNRSEPIGPDVWIQGGTGTAYSSTATSNGFISTTFGSCHTEEAYQGIISNWAISPAVILQNEDKIIFYTRTSDASWGDRLEVRLNTKNTGTNCGSGNDPGDFTLSILDINPASASNNADNANMLDPFYYKYDPANAYPQTWTRFEAKVTGLTKPSEGRFAFRYFVPFGGDYLLGQRDFKVGLGNDVMIDSVAFISASHP